MPWPENHINRTRKLQVPVTPDEEIAVKVRAADAGYKSVAAFLRALGLGIPPVAAPESADAEQGPEMGTESQPQPVSVGA